MGCSAAGPKRARWVSASPASNPAAGECATRGPVTWATKTATSTRVSRRCASRTSTGISTVATRPFRRAPARPRRHLPRRASLTRSSTADLGARPAGLVALLSSALGGSRALTRLRRRPGPFEGRRGQGGDRSVVRRGFQPNPDRGLPPRPLARHPVPPDPVLHVPLPPADRRGVVGLEESVDPSVEALRIVPPGREGLGLALASAGRVGLELDQRLLLRGAPPAAVPREGLAAAALRPVETGVPEGSELVSHWSSLPFEAGDRGRGRTGQHHLERVHYLRRPAVEALGRSAVGLELDASGSDTPAASRRW